MFGQHERLLHGYFIEIVRERMEDFALVCAAVADVVLRLRVEVREEGGEAP